MLQVKIKHFHVNVKKYANFCDKILIDRSAGNTSVMLAYFKNVGIKICWNKS